MNELTNIKIEQILKHNKLPNNGVFSKDLLPKELKNGWYIINMEDYDKGGGTHWVSFKKGKQNIYFDSFGVIYPEVVKERLNSEPIYYNKKEIQSFQSSACGYFCIGCILAVEKKEVGDDVERLNKYSGRFSTQVSHNDEILFNYLRNGGITY